MLEPMVGIEPTTYSFAYYLLFLGHHQRARLYIDPRWTGSPLSVVRALRQGHGLYARAGP